MVLQAAVATQRHGLDSLTLWINDVKKKPPPKAGALKTQGCVALFPPLRFSPHAPTLTGRLTLCQFIMNTPSNGTEVELYLGQLALVVSRTPTPHTLRDPTDVRVFFIETANYLLNIAINKEPVLSAITP